MSRKSIGKKKDDSSRNDDNLDVVVARCINKDKNLYPLRINKTTVIYVTKDKCNEKYAEQYRNKINTIPKVHEYTGKVSIEKEDLSRMICEGMDSKAMAKEFNISTTTINRKIKEYGLR